MAYTFFAIQVVIKAFWKDPLRGKIHKAIAAGDAEQTPAEKRAFYKRLTGVLGEGLPYFELGYWDLIRGSNAEAEFDKWCSEIEGSVATEREEVGKEYDDAVRLSAKNDYIIVTLLFLVQEKSNSDATLGERCDLPEEQYFSRHTFGHLIATIPMLSFATVKADAVYLVPGSDEDGLSMEDIFGGGYEYLKPLT